MALHIRVQHQLTCVSVSMSVNVNMSVSVNESKGDPNPSAVGTDGGHSLPRRAATRPRRSCDEDVMIFDCLAVNIW